MTEPNAQAIRAAFDNAASGYDALRRKLIPGFDDFYGTALDLLGEAMGNCPSFRCLDLGIGTGLLSEMILERFPAASIEGLDLAPKMIEAAAARLSRFGGRIRLAVADYAETPLPGPVDAVVSALSIHHLEHDQKRRLFRRIHEALCPGGIFVNADQSLAPTPAAEAAYQARWEAETRATGIPEADFLAALERVALDRSATLSEQIAWLEEAGFSLADVAWKRYRFTVFYARR